MINKLDSMLKRLYGKSKILFTVLWIIAYCLLMSVGDGLSAAAGSKSCFPCPLDCFCPQFYLFS